MYDSKTLRQNKELFCVKPGQIWQRRGIYLTEKIWTWVEFDIGSQFIGELFITSESKTLDFSDSGIFMDGRNREKRVGNLKIN